MKMKYGNYYLMMLMAAFLYACGGQSSESGQDAVATDDTTEEAEVVEKKVVYYATPSPVEVASIMKSSGASFSADLLNNPTSADIYTTEEDKAVNLGVYGADLAYSAMYDQTQNSINYLKTIKDMAEDLGLSGAFEEDFLKNIEDNISDRDALLDVVTEFYWSADSYLSENERPEISSLIIIGGWIESMYIACDMAHKNPENKEIRQRIGEQKLMLKNLMLYLKANGSKNEAVMRWTGHMEEVQVVFNDIRISQGSGNTVTDAEKGETVIGNETEITMTDNHLDDLCMRIQEIRQRIVQQ